MEPPKAIDQMFSYFAVVHDPRRQHPTTLHSLEAILTITILATICGAHNWVEIEQWGHAHHQWLSEFLDLSLRDSVARYIWPSICLTRSYCAPAGLHDMDERAGKCCWGGDCPRWENHPALAGSGRCMHRRDSRRECVGVAQ